MILKAENSKIYQLIGKKEGFNIDLSIQSLVITATLKKIGVTFFEEVFELVTQITI